MVRDHRYRSQASEIQEGILMQDGGTGIAGMFRFSYFVVRRDRLENCCWRGRVQVALCSLPWCGRLGKDHAWHTAESVRPAWQGRSEADRCPTEGSDYQRQEQHASVQRPTDRGRDQRSNQVRAYVWESREV